MSYPKMASLVTGLLRQTNEGKITWDQTDAPEVFQASFPRYSVRISVDKTNRFGEDYILEIVNDFGEIVEQVKDNELNNILDESYAIMKDLFEAARRTAMGVEQALDELGFLNPPSDEW